MTAARIALRLREHLKLPRMKEGNPSDSKAETGNDIVYQEKERPWHLMFFGRYLYVLGRCRKTCLVTPMCSVSVGSNGENTGKELVSMAIKL